MPRSLLKSFLFSLSSFIFYLLSFIFLACSSQKQEAPPKEKIQVASPELQLKAEPSVTEPSAAEPPGAVEKIVPQEVQIQPLPVETKPEEKALQTAQPIPYQPTVIKEGLAALLVLDASGSMNGLLGTETKFNIVRSLIEDLTPQWKSMEQPTIQLGLRTFGSENPLEANNCEDSKSLIPIGPIDLNAIQKSFEGVEPKGKNPLAFALRKASEDLSQVSGDRVIVLVTDGKDNCGQDPCTVAKEFHQGAFKIITHVIAFDIPEEEEEPLRCIAKAGNGVFLLARTKEELASSLDESLRSTLPYNLRIKALVGGTPIPTTITIYKAGTQEMLQREESVGIELFRLPPGAYDILVEYAQSIETKKPSKILKGVTLTETGKAEQEIRFDLASVTLSARDAKGEPTAVRYFFFDAGTENEKAQMESDGGETTFFIAPGGYDLMATAKIGEQEITLPEPKIEVGVEQGFVKHFAFQTGTLILKGLTSAKEPVGLLYKITRSDNPEAVVASGQVDPSGGKIDLPPGTYDILVEGQDPLLSVQPKGLFKGLTLEGGGIQEQNVVLVVGTLKITAKKGDKEKPIPVEFKITESEEKKEIATIKSPEGKTEVPLSPGKYNIEAFLTDPVYTSPPSIKSEGIVLEEGKTLEQTLTFNLGTIRLLGRNAKEQRLSTRFIIHKGGTEEIVAQAGPNTDWFEFNLSPGNYDVKAVQEDSPAEQKPYVWLRDIQIESAGALYVKEAVFTDARLRLIGRSANNEIVPVAFKVYEYGHDRPLINGTTGQDWQTFNLVPGQYYIEASFLDDTTDQVLKKWITLKVAENELVERELRF